MLPHEAVALAAIDTVYAQEAITYVGPGIAEPLALTVSWSDLQAPAFEGYGASTRSISCELLYADVPEEPDKADSRIVRGAEVYRPIDVTRADGMARWIVYLEHAEPLA